MAYGAIGGPLPFSGGGQDYASAYNAALQFNHANYNQILSGYQSASQSQQQEQQRIQAGYGQLQGQVMGTIQGIDSSQRQAIADQYAQNVGSTSQQLISRGLGNSTVQQSVARGLLYDKTKSDINLTNQTQGLNAQYLSQLGLAGLNYQNQANQQNAMQANQQLQWMNSINAAYPDARAYAQLAMMKGQAAGGGFAVPGGVPGSSGAVKSPVGPGGGSNPPGYFGGGFGGGGNTNRPNVAGYSQTVTPEASATGWGGESAGYGYGLEGQDMSSTYGTPGETWYQNAQGNWEGSQSGAVTGEAGWGDEGTDWNWIDE